MKKWCCLFLATVMLLGLCACGDCAQQQEKAAGLQVGFARENVMPVGKFVEIDGTADGRIATEILTNLTVTCIAVKGGNEETVLLYTVDRINPYSNWVSPARTAISQSTGIGEDHIMISATHTHSAPKLSGWEGAERYKVDLQAALVEVAHDALADLSDAELYFGSTETEGLVFVRHFKLKDGTVTSSGVTAGSPLIEGYAAKSDQQLQVVRFDRGEGKKEVILMNFNAHPTFHGSVEGTSLSADYPAAVREYVESKGNYQVAFFLGDAGNQAPNTKVAADMAIQAKDFREYGQRLGDYLLVALPNLTKGTGEDVTLYGLQHKGKTNRNRMELLPQAQEVMEVYRTKGRDAALALAAKYGIYQHLEASAIITRVDLPDERKIWLNVMSIGNNLSFAFAPYEMFSENGSYLRAQTPYDMTFVVSCSNGAFSYLPSAAACQYLCYEYYVTGFQPGTAEEVIDVFLEMLTTMKNG